MFFSHSPWFLHCCAVLSHSVVSSALCSLMDCIHQAPLSVEFSRQEYWNALPFPSPGDLPNPGIESESPASVGNSLPLSHQGRPKHWLSQHYLANLYKSISPHSNSTNIPITGIIFNTHIPALNFSKKKSRTSNLVPKVLLYLQNHILSKSLCRIL